MSDHVHHQDIRIGTISQISSAVEFIAQVLPHGFESFQLAAWQYLGDVDLERLAPVVLDVLGDKAVVSALCLCGNPLADAQAERDWETLIRSARLFGCSVVGGFAGALADRSVPENMPRFREVWGRLAAIAADEGVRIAFENCSMGGDWEHPKWNVAHSPRAWEMMFNEVPGDTLGLEWEPAHQLGSLIDPLPQLRRWVGRVYHVHGKDATVRWDVIRKEGLRGGKSIAWHRTPGFGDTDWTDVISLLRAGGFRGSIDIEGWHDPVYKDDLEMTGQVFGLNYLKRCRGGEYVSV